MAGTTTSSEPEHSPGSPWRRIPEVRPGGPSPSNIKANRKNELDFRRVGFFPFGYLSVRMTIRDMEESANGRHEGSYGVHDADDEEAVRDGASDAAGGVDRQAKRRGGWPVFCLADAHYRGDLRE